MDPRTKEDEMAGSVQTGSLAGYARRRLLWWLVLSTFVTLVALQHSFIFGRLHADPPNKKSGGRKPCRRFQAGVRGAGVQGAGTRLRTSVLCSTPDGLRGDTFAGSADQWNRPAPPIN